MCGSSSTTRMCSDRPVATAAGSTSARGTDAPTGSSTVNVAPDPGLVTSEMRPPCSLTIPWQIDNPRPVPSPSPLVVKNGSNTLAAGEGQQVFHDVRGALRLLADHLQRLGERGWHFFRLGEEVAEPHDRGERVVQVVRHAGDQLTYRRHFLRLYELLLQPAPLRL